MDLAAPAAPVAYGLSLPDLAGSHRLLRVAAGGETPWRIVRTHDPRVTEPPTSVGPDRAVLLDPAG